MLSVQESARVLKKTVNHMPEKVVVLGSGWSSILSNVEIESELTYSTLFGVSAGVPGHEGKLIIGKIQNKRVGFMAGRFHTYEGYSSEEVTRPIQVFSHAGMKEIIITSAAGALNEKYQVGDFVIISDIMTLFCQSPLVGPQFVDLSDAFDETMRAQAKQACSEIGCTYHDGVYAYTRGPHFETPADKMMLRHLGADVVGMSTVPETILARSMGVNVLGISFVTNLAFVKHAHSDVLAAANTGSSHMVKLLQKLLV